MATIASETFTTNTTTPLCALHRPRGLMDWRVTVFASGTWGGGSLKFQLSPDGGTTKFDIDDGDPTSPTTVTVTANRAINLYPPSTIATSSELLLYGVLSGATSPNLSVRVMDTE